MTTIEIALMSAPIYVMTGVNRYSTVCSPFGTSMTLKAKFPSKISAGLPSIVADQPGYITSELTKAASHGVTTRNTTALGVYESTEARALETSHGAANARFALVNTVFVKSTLPVINNSFASSRGSEVTVGTK